MSTKTCICRPQSDADKFTTLHPTFSYAINSVVGQHACSHGCLLDRQQYGKPERCPQRNWWKSIRLAHKLRYQHAALWSVWSPPPFNPPLSFKGRVLLRENLSDVKSASSPTGSVLLCSSCLLLGAWSGYLLVISILHWRQSRKQPFMTSVRDT